MDDESAETHSLDLADSVCHFEDILEDYSLRVSDDKKRFVSEEATGEGPLVEFYVPICLPIEESDPREYLDTLYAGLGQHLVVLMQAGAAALGLWDDEELLHSKTFKTYAVRGSGRAQDLYAKTKGKSRYGSRLRLQNARQLLVKISERLHDWWDFDDPPERIFYSCPQRTWPQLFESRPQLPFDQRDERLLKIPLHVHTPNLEELTRVHRRLRRARVVYRRGTAG